jgi:hypothetical protein
MERELHSA